MPYRKHLDILKQGVKVWNQWREERPEFEPDLKEASLKEKNLKEVNLTKADLQKAENRHQKVHRTRPGLWRPAHGSQGEKRVSGGVQRQSNA